MKKIYSVLLMFLIYISTLLIGYVSYQWLTFDSVIIKLLMVDVIMTCFIYGLGMILKNASLYDPYWSVIPPIFYAFAVYALGSQFTWDVVLILIALTYWSARLTGNWIIHWRGFKHEDWRYINIRKQAPKIYFISNLFGIHLMPTLIVFIQLIYPMHVMDSTKQPLFVWMGVIIMILAATIQWISDYQMDKYRQKPHPKKAYMDQGLWALSRHPNYFGEIALWWGLYITTINLSEGLNLYIISPILMTLMFIFISIPMMEKKILTTRPTYKQCQTEISMLLLLPKKREVESSVSA